MPARLKRRLQRLQQSLRTNLPLRATERAAFGLAVLAFLASSFCLRSARAERRVVVEVGHGAEQLLERRLVRRLVQLELSDVEIPPPHDALTSDPIPGLYVRIVRVEGRLIVQFWDRGELHGQRRLSVRGGKQLRARRIALVSAELARELALRRASTAARARRTALRERRRAIRRREARSRERVSLGSELKLASLGLSDAWLLGPSVRARYGFRNPFEISLSVMAATGQAPELESPFQWFELGLKPGYRFEISSAASIVAGIDIAAGLIRFTKVAATEGELGRQESWTARLGLFANWQQRVSPTVILYLGPEVGVLLRPIQASQPGAGSAPLSPLWLGVNVGVNVSGL